MLMSTKSDLLNQTTGPETGVPPTPNRADSGLPTVRFAPIPITHPNTITESSNGGTASFPVANHHPSAPLRITMPPPMATPGPIVYTTDYWNFHPPSSHGNPTQAQQQQQTPIFTTFTPTVAQLRYLISDYRPRDYPRHVEDVATPSGGGLTSAGSGTTPSNSYFPSTTLAPLPSARLGPKGAVDHHNRRHHWWGGHDELQGIFNRRNLSTVKKSAPERSIGRCNQSSDPTGPLSTHSLKGRNLSKSDLASGTWARYGHGSEPGEKAKVDRGGGAKPTGGKKDNNRDTGPTRLAADDIPTKSKAKGRSFNISHRQFILILVGLTLTVLPAALDESVVSNVLPQISTVFGQPTEKGQWVSSAYILAATSFSPLYGKLVTIFGIRAMLLFVSFLFMLGSGLCGLSTSMDALIGFRALTGAAGGGMIVLTFIALSTLTGPRTRGAYFGIVGAVFSLSNFMGPLVGDAFTSWISWRWGFFSSIPMGVLSIALLTASFRVPHPSSSPMENHSVASPASPSVTSLASTSSSSSSSISPMPSFTSVSYHLVIKLRRIDYIGSILFVGGIVCWLLVTQLAGGTWPWTSPLIIALISSGALLLAVFILYEIRWAPEPLLDFRRLRIIGPHRSRNVPLSCAISFAVGWTLFSAISYLPPFLMAAYGYSLGGATIRILPFMVCHSMASIAIGHMTHRPVVFRYSVAAGAVITSVGLILLYTVTSDTPLALFLFYSFLLGIGIGLPIQLAILLAQFSVDEYDMPVVTAFVNFCRMMGGAFGVVAEGAIFDSVLNAKIAKLPIATERLAGPLTSIHTLPMAIEKNVIEVYNSSFNIMFLTLGGMTIVILTAALLYHTPVPPGKNIQEKSDRGSSTSSDADLENGVWVAEKNEGTGQ
ncbi:hypothetical protein H4R33_005196 [Dimargaris cristalligena]|nr:hypothetical protein H4R33_005196 [Dimargaris cristalligena]